jgi:hypothetical protein
MEWFSAPDYSLARFVLERGLALIYALGFLNALHQFPALLGDRGLLPARDFLREMTWREAPSLFHLRYSDTLVRLSAGTGLMVSIALVAGLPQRGPLPVTMLAWLVLWLLYLSIVNIGQRFYAFGWESLLLEAGFLAVFLGNDRTPPPLLVLLLFRWLAFRVEFGAGLIKLRGDPCWRDRTCMYYHHETQPMPNPLSWYFHHLPPGFHRFEVAGNFVAQLVAPFALFLPQPVAGIGALVMIGTQAYLVVSGNYAWLNLITIVVAFSGVPDSFFAFLLPSGPSAAHGPVPAWFASCLLLLTAFVLALSYWPVRNLLAPGQLMNYAFNHYHLVNAYGAFGTITRVRHEVVIEGSAAEGPAGDGDWQEYEFPGKPGGLRRRPPQVAPYHLRLDWLMWFAALRSGFAEEWFAPLLVKLLEGDPAVLRLLRHNPFPDRPPVWVRARYYRYRFSSRAERRDTGAWWVRELAGEYVRPVRLSRAGAGRA